MLHTVKLKLFSFMIASPPQFKKGNRVRFRGLEGLAMTVIEVESCSEGTGGSQDPRYLVQWEVEGRLELSLVPEWELEKIPEFGQS